MKTIKRTVSIFLCVAMLFSMCVIGASAEAFIIDDVVDDAVTTDGYRMWVSRFFGADGMVLIAMLSGLMLSDAGDLTVTLFSAGENDELTPCCVFAANEIIVEQPDAYHDHIELYLKNDKVPTGIGATVYVLRVESDSLTDSNDGAVSAIDHRFSPAEIVSCSFDYEFQSKGSSYEALCVVGNLIKIDAWWLGERMDKLSVTTETPNLLTVRDQTTLEIVGAGNVRFTVKYNDFVYDTWTFKTFTKAGYSILKTLDSIGEYFENIGIAFLTLFTLPISTLLGMIVAWPIAPLVPIYLLLFAPLNLICSFFGVILIT